MAVEAGPHAGTLGTQLDESCYPPDLLQRKPDSSSERAWYQVNTLARQEKLLARLLTAQGIPNCLPLKPQLLTYRGRKTISHVPVISGVVFVYASTEERRRVLEMGAVASIQDVAEQEALPSELMRLTATASEGRAGVNPGSNDTAIGRVDTRRQVAGIKEWAVA